MSTELLLAKIARLEAELEIRSFVTILKIPPPEWRKTQIRSAYLCGYESGWRNKPQRAPYEREHMRSAWRTGFDAGKHESEMAIMERLSPKDGAGAANEHARDATPGIVAGSGQEG